MKTDTNNGMPLFDFSRTPVVRQFRCPIYKMRKRVVIIGAGISGLAAAKLLLQNNYDVTVLEASTDQIGGRASLRKEIGGTVAELGAQCIYGEVNLMDKFCQEIGLSNRKEMFQDIGPDDDAYLMNPFINPENGILDSSFNARLEELVQQLKDRVATDSEMDALKLQKISQARFLNLSNPITDKLTQLLAQKTFQWFTRFFKILESPPRWFRGHDAKIPVSDVRCTIMWKEPQGSAAVVKLIADIPDDIGIEQSPELESLLSWVKMGKSVVKVEKGHKAGENSINVVCKDGTEYNADFVICTLPLGVLKTSHSILFEPALPLDKVVAIENLEMSTFNTFALNFTRNDWWPKDRVGLNPIFTDYDYEGEDQNTLLDEDGCGIPNWCKAVFAIYRIDDGKSENLVLFGFLSGASAELIETLEDDYIFKSFQKFLTRILGKLDLPSVPVPESVVLSKWKSNPHSNGSFTTSTGSYDQTKSWCEALRKPMEFGNEKKIYFAGEATSTDFFGTLHGAYYSGIEAATLLINDTA